jgi:hypothetical protein
MCTYIGHHNEDIKASMQQQFSSKNVKLHYILYLMSYGILPHYGNFSSDTS